MSEKEYEIGSLKQENQGGPAGGPPGAPGGGMVGEKAKDSVKALKNLITYCRPYLPTILLALLLGAVSAVFSVVGPEKISEITDLITEGLTGSVALPAIVNICMLNCITASLSRHHKGRLLRTTRFT